MLEIAVTTAFFGRFLNKKTKATLRLNFVDSRCLIYFRCNDDKNAGGIPAGKRKKCGFFQKGNENALLDTLIWAQHSARVAFK